MNYNYGRGYIRINNGKKNIVAYRYSSLNLKLFISLSLCPNPKNVGYIYFSELGSELGNESFLSAELDYINKYCDVALIGGRKEFVYDFRKICDVPGMFLPLSCFVDLSLFYPQNIPKKYDVCFYSPFRREDIARKEVDLFLRLLEIDHSLSGVWIGGYDPEERWSMEEKYNEMIRKFKIKLNNILNEDMLWKKGEFMRFGWFSQKRWKEQKEVFKEYKKKFVKKKINLTLLFGLSSFDVAKVLNQSRLALILSKKSGCLRFLMEALATDVPVVACSDLNVCRDFVNTDTGVISQRNLEELFKNINYTLNNHNRFHPREWFSREWGLINCTKKLIEFIENHGLSFDVICGLPYLPELLMRRAIVTKTTHF